MDPNVVALILGMVGAGGGVWVGIGEFRKWRDGRAETERTENRSLVERAEAAEDREEWEMKGRRLTQESLGEHRFIMMSNGLKPPPWPNIEKILGPKPE